MNFFEQKQCIGSKLVIHNGIGPNFDLLRLGAALTVLLSHSFEIVGNRDPLRIISNGRLTFGIIAVCIFFSLSGFLVTPSLLRSKSVTRFAIKRGSRLLPGLIIVMLGLTFVIGPAMTTLPLSSYLRHPNTWYFLIEELHRATSLPGVFTDVPLSGTINGSLWTIKFECASYAILAAVGAAGLLRKRNLMAISAVSIAVFTAALINFMPSATEKIQFLQQFMGFFEFFAAGVALSLVQSLVPISPLLLVVSVIITTLSVVTGTFNLVAPISLTYAIAGFGVSRSALGRIGLKLPGDYSYGIYLWAFPIQQIVQIMFHPTWWLTNCLVSAPAILAVAGASWHLVEKPALALGRSEMLRERQAVAPYKQVVLDAHDFPEDSACVRGGRAVDRKAGSGTERHGKLA
jgi:peptidoglycan/LPS O-acetylase OafA/YrhL